MNTYKNFSLLFISGLIIFSLSACSPRILVSTGTTIGMKATPGDLQTRPPQVTFGYKRSEVAFVPTTGQIATSAATTKDAKLTGNDAFSTLAAIHFKTTWFGDTELQSVVGTGMAAREVQEEDAFKTEFQKAALEPMQLAQLQLAAVDDIAVSVLTGDKTDPDKLKKFFICSGRKADSATKLANLYAGKTKDAFIQAYKKDYAPRAPRDRDNCLK